MVHFGLGRLRLCSGAIACACLLIVQATGAQQAALTLDDVTQAPYPSGMVPAPTGSAVAWIFDAKGCRNIWVSDPSHGIKARQITVYTEDDGFNIRELAWSPDTKSIAFTRGENLWDDAPANISNSPQGPLPRGVWIVPTAGGEPRKVGEGHSPTFSPDGSRLLFLNKQTILTVDASGDGDARPLLIDQGTLDSLIWSQDGKRLAFVSHRTNHSMIGVYSFADKKIAWLSPSLDYDSSPVFSPDGARLAFIHVLPERNLSDYSTHRSGRPWSIWTADVKTGQSRPVWIADVGSGSVFNPTSSATNLFWTNRNDLVFPWEKTGWLHLYAVPAQGGTARALTAGRFEVSYVVLSHDRKRLVYSSSQNDTDRFHIWTVDVEYGVAARVDQSHAIQDVPKLGAEGTLFALQSDGNQPLHPVVLSAGGEWQPLAPDAAPSNFPSSKLVMPQSVTFTATDGQETHAQLLLPLEANSKPHPAILFFHGGPQLQMLLGFNTDSREHNWMYAFNQYLVARGSIVLSINYRGSTGYGLDYREPDNLGPGGASELNDILGAITYLRSRQNVDPRRLAIVGDSYGGFVAELGLARASDALAVGVDYAGIYNWSTFLPAVGEPIDGDDANRRALESSPIATIDQWRSPLLHVKADGDLDVPIQQSTALIDDLRAHHIDHDVIVIPNEIHVMSRYSSWMTLFNATALYLDRHLDDQNTPTR